MRELRRSRRSLPHGHAAKEKFIIELGQPETALFITNLRLTAGCGFKAEMKGNQVARSPSDGKGQRRLQLRHKGRFAWGLCHAPDRITKPMIRAKITDPWREVS